MCNRLCLSMIIMISLLSLIAMTVRLADFLSSVLIWGVLFSMRVGPFWMANGYFSGEMFFAGDIIVGLFWLSIANIPFSKFAFENLLSVSPLLMRRPVGLNSGVKNPPLKVR